MLYSFMIVAAAMAAVLPFSPARADAPFIGQTFSYYGRLPATYNSEQTVSLEVSFYETANGNDVVSRAPRIFKDHPVTSGAFTLVIAMDQIEYDAVFQKPRRPAFIQIRDLTKNQTFKRQEFLPAAEAVQAGSLATAQSAAQVSPFADQARAACIATNTAGAKYIVELKNPDVTCQSACVHSEARSVCVRGWTLYTDGRYFEFGEECTKAFSGFSTPVQARICCCLTTFRPMPVQLESAHH
jgi:hypothetical protein